MIICFRYIRTITTQNTIVKMIAGTLNEVISIYSPVITRDEFGNQKTEYTKRKETRAKVSHGGGSREVSNDEVVYLYNKEFTVRYYVEVSDFDRILWNGKFYRIVSIDKDREF